MIDCATIRDLLPLYVDEVLSKESMALITGHLATCENCKKEYADMQSEINKIRQLQNGDEKKIDLLKSMKAKIFKQKVIVAVIASVVAIVVAVGGFFGIFLYATPIEYKENIFHVERSETIWAHDDGTVTKSIGLNFVSAKGFYSSNSISRLIDVDGTETEVTFIYLNETPATRWWSNVIGNNIYRFGYTEGNPIFVEIYYLVNPRFDMLTSDEDFYALRNDGVLIWSGILE